MEELCTRTLLIDISTQNSSSHSKFLRGLGLNPQCQSRWWPTSGQVGNAHAGTCTPWIALKLVFYFQIKIGFLLLVTWKVQQGFICVFHTWNRHFKIIVYGEKLSFFLVFLLKLKISVQLKRTLIQHIVLFRKLDLYTQIQETNEKREEFF